MAVIASPAAAPVTWNQRSAWESLTKNDVAAGGATQLAGAGDFDNTKLPNCGGILVGVAVKVALAVTLPFTTTLHETVLPLQEPLHPVNVQLEGGVAFMVTVVPLG